MNEKVGIFGAIGAAVLASVCCIGPVVLAGLSVGAVAAAQQFAPWRPVFLALTAVFLGVAFYFAYRKPKEAACAGQACELSGVARWMRPLQWVVTAMVVALVAFPYYYGPLRAARDRPMAPAAASTPVTLMTAELKVAGMTCGGCAVSVRNALLEVPGVATAEVDHEAGLARVQYNSAKVSVERLIDAVNQAGFRASL